MTSGTPGGLAHAHYKEVPLHIAKPVTEQLPPEIFETITEFSKTYPLSLFH